MRCTARLLVPLIAALVLAVGCESTPKQTTPPIPQPPPPPPPPKEAAPTYRAQLHAEIAAGYYERGQMDIALEELAEARKLDPNNPKIYNVYGLVYAMIGQEDNARQNFQQALTLAPNDSEIRHNWGWYLCTNGRARESIAEFELALANPLYKNPDAALTNAGRCAASYGDTKRAEEFFRRALVVAPGNTGAAYNLALLSYKNARMDEARAYLRRVMQQPSPTPEALYLGMCIERKLGDRAAETSYASQLRNRYPDAPETKAIPSGVCE